MAVSSVAPVVSVPTFVDTTRLQALNLEQEQAYQQRVEAAPGGPRFQKFMDEFQQVSHRRGYCADLLLLTMPQGTLPCVSRPRQDQEAATTPVAAAAAAAGKRSSPPLGLLMRQKL